MLPTERSGKDEETDCDGGVRRGRALGGVDRGGRPGAENRQGEDQLQYRHGHRREPEAWIRRGGPGPAGERVEGQLRRGEDDAHRGPGASGDRGFPEDDDGETGGDDEDTLGEEQGRRGEVPCGEREEGGGEGPSERASV